MTAAAACPYCRAAVDSSETAVLLCHGCGTPHHADCFDENGGCTVFGCIAAPAGEPKLSINTPDLHQYQPNIPLQVVASTVPPLPPFTAAVAAPSIASPPMFSSSGYVTAQSAPYMATTAPSMAVFPANSAGVTSWKNRTTFLLLGVILGAFGAHSFYAGSTKKGFFQLAITTLTLGFGGVMVWIWAIIDICTITTDHEGLPFRTQ